jgi:hypothetical protein
MSIVAPMCVSLLGQVASMRTRCDSRACSSTSGTLIFQKHLAAHIAPAAELVRLHSSAPGPLCITVRVPFDPATHTIRTRPNAEAFVILIDVLPALLEHRAYATDGDRFPIRLCVTTVRIKEIRLTFACCVICP